MDRDDVDTFAAALVRLLARRGITVSADAVRAAVAELVELDVKQDLESEP